VPLRPFDEVELALSRDDLVPEVSKFGPFGAALGRLLPGWAGGASVDEEAGTPPLAIDGRAHDRSITSRTIAGIS
jgi:hypothetical protein